MAKKSTLKLIKNKNSENHNKLIKSLKFKNRNIVQQGGVNLFGLVSRTVNSARDNLASVVNRSVDYTTNSVSDVVDRAKASAVKTTLGTKNLKELLEDPKTLKTILGTKNLKETLKTTIGAENLNKLITDKLGKNDLNQLIIDNSSEIIKKLGKTAAISYLFSSLTTIGLTLTSNFFAKMIRNKIIARQEAKDIEILNQLITKFLKKIVNNEKDLTKTEILELEIISSRTKNLLKYMKDKFKLSNSANDYAKNKEYLETMVKLEDYSYKLDKTISEYKGYLKHINKSKRFLKRTSKIISKEVYSIIYLKLIQTCKFMMKKFIEKNHHLLQKINSYYNHFNKSIDYNYEHLKKS